MATATQERPELEQVPTFLCDEDVSVDAKLPGTIELALGPADCDKLLQALSGDEDIGVMILKFSLDDLPVLLMDWDGQVGKWPEYLRQLADRMERISDPSSDGFLEDTVWLNYDAFKDHLTRSAIDLQERLRPLRKP